MHKAYRHVVHGGNECEWVDASCSFVRVGESGLKMCTSRLQMNGSGWEWIGVGESGWKLVGVHGIRSE